MAWAERPVERMTLVVEEQGVVRHARTTLALTRREATLCVSAGLASGVVSWVTATLLLC